MGYISADDGRKVLVIDYTWITIASRCGMPLMAALNIIVSFPALRNILILDLHHADVLPQSTP